VTDGLVIVDKPAGWTSHDVVARCRRIFDQRRVGHSGTLDPGATGVLLVGLGRVTRLLRFLTDLPKTYVGEVVLGVATSTLDDEGQKTGEWDMADIALEDVRRAAIPLTGAILQVPPMVSAVQIGGRRLHELARAGVEVDRPARPVTVYRFDVGELAAPGVFRIEVACSSGTYVRVLAADLGTALGGGAHLRGLRRTAIGSFSLSESMTLEAIADAGAAAVRQPAEAVRDYPGLQVGEDIATLVASGRPLDPSQLPGVGAGSGPWAILGPSGSLLAIYQRDGERLRPAVVLATQ
jgi:tRNA pseudouridine55 synthase